MADRLSANEVGSYANAWRFMRNERLTGDGGDQAAVVAFLADPSSYGGVSQVDRLETHGNLVFLAGADAWKIKRAVRFPYMDFSTLEKRRVACVREVEVNQPVRSRPLSRLRADHPLCRRLRFRSAAQAISWNGPSTCAASSSRRC